MLDYFCILCEKQLRYLLNEFVGCYYHSKRPHQATNNVPPMADKEFTILKFLADRVRCHKRLGGLLKSYYRSAADAKHGLGQFARRVARLVIGIEG